VIAPRSTTLVRADNLSAVRRVLFSLACRGDLADVRHRALIVPSRAAALQLRQTLETLRFGAAPSSQDPVLFLPELLTRDDWYQRMHERAGFPEPRLTPLGREIMLGAAAREAIEAGAVPPFRLRPGLIAEMLAFYDALCRQQRTVETFERVVLGDLESRADVDRGAERLLRQTRFLVAAFRAFDARVTASGALDEQTLRRRLLDPASDPGFTHIVVTVGDRTSEPSGGLYPADFDLMMRLPGVEAVDIVATRGQLASGLHERLHELIPGLEEIDVEGDPASPRLTAPASDPAHPYFISRDREEELRDIARRIKETERRADPVHALDRVAVVFKRPLPYVYLARTVFDAAGIEYQTADALPLAAEPMAAVLDLLLAAVESRFARTALLAVLRSPHLRADPGHEPPSMDDIDAFDRGLSEERYLGDPQTLARLAEEWSGAGAQAARAAAALTLALEPLCVVNHVSAHAATLLDFLRSHERMDFRDDAVRSRHLRARGAVMTALERLRQAAVAFDDPRARFTDVAATIRRWIESQTFSPRRGTRGVQLADVQAARYGAFDVVHIAGLAEGDWPEPSPRNIFYPAFLLSQLGWPSESARLSAARAAFLDLLTLPRDRVSISTFTLEDDSIVNPSPLLEEVSHVALAVDNVEPSNTLVFVDEALAASPPVQAAVTGDAGAWVELRAERSPKGGAEFHGHAGPVRRRAHTVTAIDRFLQCPFKYFAATILELPEEVTDEASMTPRAEGQFVHEVFRAFFDSWQSAGGGTITPDVLEEARAQFARVAVRLLGRLPAAEAVLQRMRLLGSAGTRGLGEIVLAAEASRPTPVRERLLEYSLDGEFTIAAGGVSRPVRLRGQADRIDLLADGRFRLIDYKNTRVPDPAQTIQLPVYAVCAQQELQRTRGERWEVGEASYIAFGERKPVRVIIDEGPEAGEKLADGQRRLLDAIDRIERGEFPPQPVSRRLCGYCAYASVCRKDYVDGE
jgi:RecB family exonuclease